MLFLLLPFLGHAAECPQPIEPTALAAKVDDALLTWATMDEEGFAIAADAIAEDVACLDEPLSPEQAAAVHRVQGLRAFLDGNVDGASGAFQAAAIAEPGYRLSERLAPEGGKLWRLYQEAADKRPPLVYPMRVPSGFRSWVDGKVADRKAEELPAIVQVGDRDVQWSAYVVAGQTPDIPDLGRPSGGLDPVPLEPVPKEPLPDDGVVDLDGPGPKAPGNGPDPVAMAAVGTGVVAAGLFATSAVVRSGFDDAPTRGKYNTINGAFIGSMGMTAVTGALFGVAIARAGK